MTACLPSWVPLTNFLPAAAFCCLLSIFIFVYCFALSIYAHNLCINFNYLTPQSMQRLPRCLPLIHLTKHPTANVPAWLRCVATVCTASNFMRSLKMKTFNFVKCTVCWATVEHIYMVYILIQLRFVWQNRYLYDITHIYKVYTLLQHIFIWHKRI